MLHKAVIYILMLCCFSLSSYSGENDERKAEAEGIAVPSGICDRTIQVQKALLAKAGKETCEQMTDQDLQAIVILDLSNENITQLKTNDFSGLTSLQRLYLSYNQLESLPMELFSGLTSLQSLDLFNNKLASLPEGIFSHLTSLQSSVLKKSILWTKWR